MPAREDFQTDRLASTGQSDGGARASRGKERDAADRGTPTGDSWNVKPRLLDLLHLSGHSDEAVESLQIGKVREESRLNLASWPSQCDEGDQTAAFRAQL